MAFRKMMLFSIILTLLFSFPMGATRADNDDALLTLSLETSKSYESVYRLGTKAKIHNVTITGRLLNTTSYLGIPHQNISIHYQNVSERFTTHDSEWSFINNASTDNQGYYSYIWIPPTTEFVWPEEHEVIYRVKAAWQHRDSTAAEFGEVYISIRELPPPPMPSPIYVAQPFLVTGLFLSGAIALSIVIFNKFGGVEGARESSTFSKKTALYLVAFLSLWFAILGLPGLLAKLIPYSYIQALPGVAPFIAAPAVLALSIPRFFRHLKRGNKLKTVLSSIVITWAALQVLILSSVFLQIQGVSFLFFTTQKLGAYYIVVPIVYLISSATLTLALFLLLIFLKEERTVSELNPNRTIRS